MDQFMKKLLASTLLLILGACATDTPSVGEHGVVLHHIECGVGVSSVCYDKAAAICSKGYTAVDQGVEGGILATAYGLTVRCK